MTTRGEVAFLGQRMPSLWSEAGFYLQMDFHMNCSHTTEGVKTGAEGVSTSETFPLATPLQQNKDQARCPGPSSSVLFLP